MRPPNLLSHKDSPCKFVSLLKEEGMIPVKEFWAKYRARKLKRLPISLGRLPEIELCPKERVVNEVERLEIESGRTPANLQ